MPDRPGLYRRDVLRAGALGVGAATLAALGGAAVAARRGALSVPRDKPEIQYDIGAFLGPVETIEGTAFRFGPVYTLFLTLAMQRAPQRADQRIWSDTLDTIEDTYPFRPDGVFSVIAYGRPYFERLPSGLVDAYLPRLTDDPARPALEEAVPAPTDVAPGNSALRTRRLTTPVRIESNDVLVTLRSDRLDNLHDVARWLDGSGRLAGRPVTSPPLRDLSDVTSRRLMFLQRGLPRRLAEASALPFTGRIHPRSPMWMGFSDQQADASGPAELTTMRGSAEARFTDVAEDGYFARAAVQHLSHTILDLAAFYGGDPARPFDDEETYLKRVQYMFRGTPPPALGDADQFRDGGGPAFLPNDFLGVDDAERGARGDGTPDGIGRIGHVTALQRSSRTASGRPLHIRVDGPGFDDLDVTDRSRQPKLHFSVFVPTAETFARMRRDGAAVDLARQHRVREQDVGLERFLTTTRRQNFLVPPRSHRAFPLVELA